MSFQEIVKNQWQIPEPRLWKSTEYWPDNIATQNANTDLRKVYFFCNPKIDEVANFDGRIFFLYLDLDSHVQMAEYKHAGKFFNESISLYKSYFPYYRSKLNHWKKHYNNIKDPSWPRCTGPAGFRALPGHIQQELMENPFTANVLNIKKYAMIDHQDRKNTRENLLVNKSLTDDGIQVMPEVKNFWPHADITLRLTDIINDLNLLSRITQTPTNQEQVDLRNQWVKLHPSSLLNTIGINTTLESTQHAEQS